MRNIYIFLFILWSNLAFASHVLVLVDGKAITSIDVNKRIEALKIANPELEVDNFVRQHILNNLISEELFHNEAKRLKVSVSEEEILSHFKSMQQEHQFSPALTEKLIKNQSLRMQVESQILWNRLVSLVLAHKIKVSDAEIRDEQKVNKGEIREVSFKQIIFEEFEKDKAIKLQQEAKNCQDLDRLAREYGLGSPYNGNALLSELNPDLQSVIKVIPENRLSDPLNFNKQKQVVMVCNKKIIDKVRSIQEIRADLTNRKINGEAQKYLAELRKRVYIEYTQ
jgi:hypothetical protein